MHDYGFCVNQCQSPEQRKYKYKLVYFISNGDSKLAQRLRDWNWSKLQGELCRKFEKDSEGIKEWIKNSYDLFIDEIKNSERGYREWKNL